MDKEIHDHQQALSSNAIKQESPKRPPQLVGFGGGGNINNDRLKRDEWSEGAVSTLLEAYESKWKLRNRAKLKGQDWEDVAKYVSSRSNGTKTPKTQTQCKNKIESMKKRYRSESVNTDASSWPLYQRLDLLLRGDSSGSTAAVAAAAAQTSLPLSLPQPITQVPPPLSVTSAANPDSLILMGQSPVVVKPPPPPVVFAQPLPQPVGTQQQNSHGSNGVEKGAKEDGEVGPTISDHESDKKAMDTDSSTPALYSDKEKLMRHRRLKKKKRKIREEMEIADSVRWLAEVVVRSEQSRMETMKEIEKMRIEAEAKRSEMDLKRTEIIANTQLEIAKIFAAAVAKNVDSSLKIGRS